MISGLPKVIICGSGVVYAENLKKFIEEKELEVRIVTGNDETELLEGDYVLDLVGITNFWDGVLGAGIRLVVVTENIDSAENYEKLLEGKEGWRVLLVENLFGEYFPDKVSWLSKLFTQTVLNSVLQIPTTETFLLYEKDMFEVASRLLFFSGGENGVYGLRGRGIAPTELETALREAGRMTTGDHQQIEVESRLTQELLDKTIKATRYEPRVGFAEVAEIALRPYFSRVDSLSRQKAEAEETIEAKQPARLGLATEVVEETMIPEIPEKSSEVEEVVREEEIEEEPIVFPEFSIKNSKITIDPQLSSWQELFKIEEVAYKDNKRSPRGWKWGKGWGKKGRLGLWGIGILLTVFLLWQVGELVRGVMILKDNFTNLESRLVAGKWEEAEKSNLRALAVLEAGKKNRVVALFPESDRLISLGIEAVRMEQAMVPLLKQVQGMGAGIFGEKEVGWKDNILQLMVSLADVEATSSNLYARMSGDLGWAPKSLYPTLVGYKQKLSGFREKLVVAHSAVPILPDLLGLDGKRREYLVLLQNEMELRATGGFIGSYGVLTLEDGKLLNFEIRDVYATDGQLKGYVEPPGPIKEYLGEASWHMRDANYSPNFVQAAKDIRWFYEKSTGDRVDGVIGINLAVVFRILQETGSIYVPDFQVKVSKDTLFEQAESYSENNFFPGSKQKQSFLGALSKQLFEELRVTNSTVAGKVAGAMLSSLESRDMQMAVNNSNTAKRLSALNWSGELYEGSCEKGCVADYFFPVESNFGVNKANYFIRRKIEGKSWWEGGSLKRKVIINWENTAKNGNWPAGDYKNYLRVYLPETVDMEKVVLTDGEARGSRKEYADGEYVVKKFGSRKELSLFLVVPVGKKRSLEVTFQSQEGGSPGTSLTYLQYIQRQSGLGDKTNMTWSVALPDGYLATQTEPEGKLSGSRVEFESKLEKDYKLGVEITRK